MRISKFERLFQKNFDKRDNFKHLADYLVKHHTVGLDEERKRDVSADTALGMALGEALTKNGYLLKGMTIGAIGTGLAVAIGKKIKDRRDADEKLTKEELEEMGIKTFEAKSFDI